MQKNGLMSAKDGNKIYHFVVNPASRSGKGKRLWKKVQKILEEKEITYEVHFTKHDGNISQLVSKLMTREEELVLVVLGGDGTMNQVVQAIDTFDKVCVGYIPTGSSNDLGRSMRFTQEIEREVDKVLKCNGIVDIDVGQVTLYDENHKLLKTRKFLVSSGIGYDAEVCEVTFHSRMKKVLNKFGLGKLTYLGIALRLLMNLKDNTATITLDNEKSYELNKFIFAACMNHPYEGGGFMFCPKADYRDRILDVCFVNDLPLWRILYILPLAFKGRHVGKKNVHIERARKVTVKSDAPLFVHTDGELPGACYEAKWECLDKRMRLIV